MNRSFESTRRGVQPRAASALALVLVLAGVGLAGCRGRTATESAQDGGQRAASDVRPRFLFISNGNSPWWTAVETGMRDAGQALGCDVELRRNEQGTPGQIRLLDDALSLPDVQGVAISVYQADAPGIADKLKLLNDQGKVVICIDSDIAAESAHLRRAYIGTINYKAGEAAGRAARVLRPEGGPVVAFVGTSAAANARERLDGFFAAAGDRFIRTEVFDDNNDLARARINVQTAISKYPELAVLLGVWSYNAPAIAQEMAMAPDVRKRTTVVTFDLEEAAVADLQIGRIDASVCQNPYEMGYQGVKLLKAFVEADETAIAEVLPDGKMRDTGVRVIVPSGDSPVMKALQGQDDVVTIEEMRSWLASKGLTSS